MPYFWMTPYQREMRDSQSDTILQQLFLYKKKMILAS